MSVVVPHAILSHYGPAIACLRWFPVAGGFSGAAVWRGDDDTGTPILALKGWPAGTTVDRLTQIHRWMARAAHLPFVPAVLPTRDRSPIVTEAGRVWDLTHWMSGTPDATPSPARIAAACAALAALHRVWAAESRRMTPCPAIARRLAALADWRDRQPLPRTGHPELDALLHRGADVVRRFAPDSERRLHTWADRSVAVQPCLCDVHGEHVLFTGDAVTGVIDYGAMKFDHVAVDLARLLGDLVGDDEARFAAGLQSYREAGGEAEFPDALVRLLDRTGAVCAVAVWLLRLSNTATAPGAVAHRLAPRVARLEALISI